jgi:hypothetical protein
LSAVFAAAWIAAVSIIRRFSHLFGAIGQKNLAYNLNCGQTPSAVRAL